jgi:hypothetical protein
MDMRVASGMIRYGLPGMVLGVALCWVAGTRGPEASAQTERGAGSAGQTSGTARSSEGTRVQPARQNTVGETNGTLALITGSAGSAGQSQSQWLYLIDTKSRSFALYRIDPSNPKGIVKLEASRQYEWDLKLEHYNNQPPEPDAIKATVQTLSRSTPQ